MSSSSESEVERIVDSKELKKIKKNPKEYAKESKTAHLSEVIEELSDAYYNEEEPLVSDEVFDILSDELKARKKDTNVGAAVKENKVALPYYIGSLAKKKPDSKELDKWIEEYDGMSIVSDKLDGDSSILHQKDGKLRMYTRGNGFIGKDISHLIKFIFDDDDELPDDDFTARGELIVTKKDFEKLQKDGIKTSAGNPIKNSRNLISIVVNSKKVDDRVKKIIKYVKFVTYRLYYPIKKPSDQLKWLKKNNFDVVYYETVDDLDNKYLYNKLIERKKKSEYDIDGLVVAADGIYKLIPDKHPKDSFAYKLESEEADVKVLDVLWEESQYGYLKPRILIETISLSGVDIKYATAHNAKFVVDNKIGIGAIVTITRSGEVIPKIVKIVKPAKEIKYPKQEYKWNETKVDFVIKKNSKLVLIKGIYHFFKTIGVENMGLGIVTKLVNEGYDSVKKIIKSKVNNLAEIEGLGDKSATKIKNSINSSLDKVTLSQLMSATLIFGRGFGEKKIIVILKEYPDIVDSKYGEEKLTNKISDIHGFDTKTAKQFAKNLPAFKEFLEFMSDVLDVEQIKKRVPKNITDNKSKINGMKIVFTGFRDKALQKKIEEMGGKLTGSVSKNTNIVVASDIDEASSKIQTAKKLGIKIMSIEEFKKTI